MWDRIWHWLDAIWWEMRPKTIRRAEAEALSKPPNVYDGDPDEDDAP